MNERRQDEIIEEWMKEAYPQYSTVTDLELAEGLHYVKSLRKLINITEEIVNEYVVELHCYCVNHPKTKWYSQKEWNAREQKINDLIAKAKRDAKKEVFNDIEKIENSNGNHLLNQIDLDNQMKYEELKQRHLPKEDDETLTNNLKKLLNKEDRRFITTEINNALKNEEEKKH